MTDEELIEILWNGEVTLGVVASAATRIQELLNQQAFIREAALLEAAAVAEALENKWWGDYKNRLSPYCADPQYQGMSDGAGYVAAAIEALIGEKK